MDKSECSRKDLLQCIARLELQHLNDLIQIETAKSAGKPLQNSEEVYRHLVNVLELPAVVATLDEGMILLFNDAAFSFFNGQASEAVDLHGHVFLFRREDRDRLAAALSTDGAVTGFEAELENRHGVRRWGIIAANTVDYGGKRAYVCVFSDVTEFNDVQRMLEAEQALAESEQKFHGLYDSLKDGVTRTDMQGRILECNQAFLDMLGYARGEVTGLTYRQITPEKWWTTEEEFIRGQVLTRGYSNVFEKEYIKKDGTVFPATLRVWLSEDSKGQPAAMWGIARDITERKHLQASREALILELQAALAKVRTLSGLLPICSHCKKIRDDKGYWNQIEAYISEHSSAEFTHGICPQCARELYPDLLDRFDQNRKPE